MHAAYPAGQQPGPGVAHAAPRSVYLAHWPTPTLSPTVARIDRYLIGRYDELHPFAAPTVDVAVGQLLAALPDVGQSELRGAVAAMWPHFQQIRAADDFCTHTIEETGSTRLLAQHCASGMHISARVYPARGRQLIRRSPIAISVNTNSGDYTHARRENRLACHQKTPGGHRTPPQWLLLAAADSDPHQSMRYARLGIGSRLYRVFSTANPPVRFGADSLRQGSSALRRRMHFESPWVWEDPTCPACGNQAGRGHWSRPLLGRGGFAARHSWALRRAVDR